MRSSSASLTVGHAVMHRNVASPLGSLWKPLPERLRDEWYDRVQQPQRMVESVYQHRTRDIAIVAGSGQPPFGRFNVPIGELIPNETASSFGVLVEPQRAERGVALDASPWRRRERESSGRPAYSAFRGIDRVDRQ